MLGLPRARVVRRVLLASESARQLSAAGATAARKQHRGRALLVASTEAPWRRRGASGAGCLGLDWGVLSATLSATRSKSGGVVSGEGFFGFFFHGGAGTGCTQLNF